MIIGIVGNMGAGKTLSATVVGATLKMLKPDAHVVSNYHISYTDRIVDSPLQLNKLSKRKSGIQILDEVWAWMDSRQSGQNDLMTELVINSRKRGWIVIWTAQNADMVDKRLRKNTDILVKPSHRADSVGEDILEMIWYHVHSGQLERYTVECEAFYGTYDTREEVSTDARQDLYDEMIEIVKGNSEECDLDERPKYKKEAISHLVARHGYNRSDAEIAVAEAYKGVDTMEDK